MRPANYVRRDQTRREHAAELQAILGLRSFRLGDWRDCLRVGANADWATEHGEPIVPAMLTHLRTQAVLVPDATVLERIGDPPSPQMVVGPRRLPQRGEAERGHPTEMDLVRSESYIPLV